MERMTDADAKALLNILASDRLPVVSTARRQAVILHALQAIEDRAVLVRLVDGETPGVWPEKAINETNIIAAAHRHMEGQ